MFSGIIQTIGRVARAVPAATGSRLDIDAAGLDLSDARIGDSIAVNGVCLTAIALGPATFAVDVSRETLDCTVGFAVGAAVNLELALRAGDRLGGHFVTGHVDGVGELLAIEPDGDCRRFSIRVPSDLARYVARKGSIAVDGVSLTVNEVTRDTFGVNLIPHTLLATTLGSAAAGRRINLEIDLLARYLDRIAQADKEEWK